MDETTLVHADTQGGSRVRASRRPWHACACAERKINHKALVVWMSKDVYHSNPDVSTEKDGNINGRMFRLHRKIHLMYAVERVGRR